MEGLTRNVKWSFLKGIPLELTQHKIKLDTVMLLVQKAQYQMDLNYVVVVKLDIDKLLATSFTHVNKVIWLSPKQ